MPAVPPLSTFDGLDVATLQAMRAQAQQAYVKLMMGRSAREVVTLGDAVKYQATTAEQMQALIAQLNAAIAGRSSIGAIGVLWAG